MSVSPFDKSFKKSFEEIHNYFDYHFNDGKETFYQNPSVTLIELFSLLSNMQQVYMNYVGDEHYLRFIGLLGEKPERMRYSKAAVEFYDVNDVTEILKGFQVFAGDVCFEITDDCLLSTNALKEIVLEECGKHARLDPEGQGEDTFFYPFGIRPKEGNCFYLGFAEDLRKSPIHKIYAEGSRRETAFPGFLPLGRLACEALCRDENGDMTWEKVDIKDHTICLLEDGDITISDECINSPMHKCPASYFAGEGFFSEEQYWIRFVLTENYYEQGFPLTAVKINTFIAEQRVTLTDCPVGSSDGTPGQSFQLMADSLDEDSVRLRVGEDEGWEKTDYLLTSSPNDKHFMIRGGTMFFGNGESGAIPCEGKNNIKITSCRSSLGAGGNVKKHEINATNGEYGFHIRNISCSKGGKNRESIDEAISRIREELDVKHKAVSLSDYEEIVMKIPILGIDRVRATFDAEEPEAVNLIIKPKSRDAMPMLNPRYIQNILAYLEPYRILTTKINILPASYLGVSVSLYVTVHPHTVNAEEQITNAIDDVFPETVRSFGESVPYSEIYGAVIILPCISRIRDLKLECDGNNYREGVNGDINVSLDTLTYRKSLKLEID